MNPPSSAPWAVFGGVVFILAVLVPMLIHALGATRFDRELVLLAFMLVGMTLAGCLYGVSVALRKDSGQPEAPAGESPASDKSRPGPGAAKLMAKVKLAIELEHWKEARDRARELIAAWPKSPEAAKLKKNLEYLDQKSQGAQGSA